MSLLVQAASYMGDRDPAGTVRFCFNVTSAAGVLSTLAGSPAITVYRDSGTTESATGASLTVDFDGRTGLCQVVINCAANPSFYLPGSDYEVVLTAGTVGLVDVSGTTVGHFSLALGTARLSDGVLHGGSTARLRLGATGAAKALQVTADSGPAASLESTSGIALDCTSASGTGARLQGGEGLFVGGTAGNAVHLTAGGFAGLEIETVAIGVVVVSDGPAVQLQSSGDTAVRLTGDGTAPDVQLAGTGLLDATIPGGGTGDVTSINGTPIVGTAVPAVLADGVAHGGTPGASTATLALARIAVHAAGDVAVSLVSDGADCVTVTSPAHALALTSSAGDAVVITAAGVGLDVHSTADAAVLLVSDVDDQADLELGGSGLLRADLQGRITGEGTTAFAGVGVRIK